MPDPPDRLADALKDRYQLQRELGHGGMATVYLATDLKHERAVAVKVLKPELAAVLGADRFLREIKTTAQLTHPHILPLLDSGDADGTLFYVMPYVEGESLRDRLDREKQLPVEDALQISREVADALSYAHSRGVIHRDIKPENILLQSGHAVVADFGIARAIDQAGGDRLTETGVALGTPAYMSPEQAGGSRELDGRSDLYSLGCALYEMLAGKAPFTGPTVESVIHQHLAADPPSIGGIRPSVPSWVVAALERSLAKTPADRFNPVAQFAEAIAPRASATEPVRARISSSRSRWWLLGGTAIVVVAGLLAIFGVRPFHGSEAEGGTVAVFPFVTQSTDSADVWLAEGLSEQIGSRLARLPLVRVLSTDAVAMQQRGTPDPLEAGRALDVRWVVTGSLRHTEGEIRARTEVAVAASAVQVWSASFSRADGDFEALQQEMAESVAVVLVGHLAPAAATSVAVSDTTHREAYRLFLIGNALLKRRTPETVMQAVSDYGEAVRRDPQFAAAWAKLASARLVQYIWADWPEADVPRDSLPALVRTAVKAALAADPGNAAATSVLGVLAGWVDRDFVTARREFERALELDSLNPDLWYSYGSTLGTEGANDLPSAERMLRRSLAIEPDQPNAWRQLAMAVAFQGRLAESEALLDTVVALGPWSPAFSNRAYVRFLRGNGRGALSDLKRATEIEGGPPNEYLLAMYGIANGDSQPAIALLARRDTTSAGRAQMYAALGRQQDALDVLTKRAPGFGTWMLLHDPIFAPLRSDPRFVHLLEASQPPGAR
jgi:TolB-like protein